MGNGCKAVLLFVFLALLFLYQLIIPLFIVPINGQCNYNDVIPPDPKVNLSMDSWSTGGMWAAIVIFVLFFSSGKMKTESDCGIFCLVILFILYQLFDLVWNIIGLIIYSDFYEQACKFTDGYSSTMNLAFYSGLISSSIMLITIVVFICALCREERAEVREPLLQQPQVPPQNQQVEKERVKVESEEEKREEVVMTDAEYQRQQNVYARLFERISGAH